MSYDSPEPDPPEPEDDPESHANYLRRKVIAAARQYFYEHGELDLRNDYSYFPACVTLEEIAETIRELDKWKQEFDLKDID